MKLSQLIEYNKRNIFFKNHAENEAERLDPHLILFCKDTHRKMYRQIKLQRLKESTNMDVWVVGTLNQLFIRGS